jgi:hypothetical protein
MNKAISIFSSFLEFLLLQPSQPIFCILNLREAGIGGLPEGEETNHSLGNILSPLYLF